MTGFEVRPLSGSCPLTTEGDFMMSPSPKPAPPKQQNAPGANIAQSISGRSSNQRPQCLLIVCGAPECLRRLLAALNNIDVEITSVVSPEEIARACCRKYDLVIVCADPRQMEGILRSVRESAQLADSPVLVERSRLDALPGLTGVLPRYRAMPCGYSDLLKLARAYLSPLTSSQQSGVSSRWFL